MPALRRDPLPPPRDPGLQQERTLLAWRRTTMAMGVAALIVLRLSLTSGGWALTLPLLVVTLASVGWCLVVIARRTRNAPEPEAGFQAVARDGVLPALSATIVALLCLTEIVVALSR